MSGAKVPAGPPPDTPTMPTGAQIGTGRIPLTCDVPFLGAQTFLASATGAVATALGPGQQFWITEVHGSLEVSDWIRDAAPLLGVTSADARVTKIDITTTNATPSVVNAVADPLVVTDIPVRAGTPMVVPAPQSGPNMTVGPFTAGTGGDVELGLGDITAEITLKNAGGGVVLWPLTVNCRTATTQPLVIAAISINSSLPSSPASRYDGVPTPTFGLAAGDVEGSLSGRLECTIGNLGTAQVDGILTGELPGWLPQGQGYFLRQASGRLIFPASLVDAALAAFPAATQATGTIDKLEINSVNATPATRNVASPAIAVPAVQLRQGQGVNLRIPGTGLLTVGPWTPGAGPDTTMTWGASGGSLQLRNSAGTAVGAPLTMSCSPPRGQVILLRQAVTTGPVPRVTGLSVTSGPAGGGNQVTITGSCFTGALAVSFGAGTASFNVSNDTTIVANPPIGRGAVDVTVLGVNGSSAILPAGRYTYTG
jgi:hypothetical protein